MGSVGRAVPLRISEFFWKYMPRSQIYNTAVARPCWGLNEALTPRQKRKIRIFKWRKKIIPHILVFQEKRFDLNVTAQSW